MRIPGIGWEKARRIERLEKAPFSWRANAICCLASIALLTAVLLGAGYLIFDDWPRFLLMLAIAIPATALIVRHMPTVLSQGQDADTTATRG